MKNIISLFLLLSATNALAINKVIIGSDGRYRITEAKKTKLHDAVGLLIITDKNNNTSTCTGTLVSKRHVLTSAHCIVDDNNIFNKNISFLPGINHNFDRVPENKLGIYQAAKLSVYAPYLENKYSINDIGIIELSTDVKITPLKIKLFNKDRNLVATGYPGDKALGTQWETRGNLAFFIANAHKLDTYAGQSGSGIRNNANEIVAVHSGGGDYSVISVNVMASITPEIMRYLKLYVK